MDAIVKSVTDPVIDVIIPVHNQGDWVDLSIRSVENFTKAPFRLIIVDNASTEPRCLDVLKAAEARGHVGGRNPENKSFSNSCNVGIARGTAPNIVILNDDALVTPSWDGHLLQDLADPTVG